MTSKQYISRCFYLLLTMVVATWARRTVDDGTMIIGGILVVSAALACGTVFRALAPNSGATSTLLFFCLGRMGLSLHPHLPHDHGLIASTPVAMLLTHRISTVLPRPGPQLASRLAFPRATNLSRRCFVLGDSRRSE